MQEESDTYDVVEHNILIGRRLYTGRTRSARCYITLDPYQQVMLIQSNQISMMLYKPDVDQEATLYQKNQVSMMLYNSGSCSAGPVMREEPDPHDETSK